MNEYYNKINKNEYYNKINKKETNMLEEIKKSIGDFFKENRQLITWIVVLFLVDHFALDGRLRQKLDDIVDKLIHKVSGKVEEIK